MGKPLAPLVQLLAVLPPESKQLLPLPYRLLMTVRAPGRARRAEVGRAARACASGEHSGTAAP